MTDNTRKRILDLLHEHHTLTTQQIARLLGLTTPGVRYAIQALLVEKTITRVPLAPGEREAGRPVHNFQLASPPLTPAGQLLQALLESGTNRGSLPSPQEIARLLRDSPCQGSLSARLNMVCRQPFLAGRQAQWAAGKDGPLLRFDACPFLGISAASKANDSDALPYPCQVDLAMVERCLDAPVSLQASILRNQRECLLAISVTP